MILSTCSIETSQCGTWTSLFPEVLTSKMFKLHKSRIQYFWLCRNHFDVPIKSKKFTQVVRLWRHWWKKGIPHFNQQSTPRKLLQESYTSEENWWTKPIHWDEKRQLFVHYNKKWRKKKEEMMKQSQCMTCLQKIELNPSVFQSIIKNWRNLMGFLQVMYCMKGIWNIQVSHHQKIHKTTYTKMVEWAAFSHFL